MLLKSIESCKIKTDESISLHTSLKIGGKCDTFVVPKTMEGVKSVIDFVNQNELTLVVIGNGTNILAPDERIPGIVIKIGEPYFSSFYLDSGLIKVGAGVPLIGLLKTTVTCGLSGLEFAAGIPGTLGGAIVMNAGAQGKTIGEIVKRVKVIDRRGNVYWMKNSEINFGYRESKFKRGATSNSGEIIVEAELKLKKGDSAKIRDRIQEILKKRASSLPLSLPSAGCVFKNPKNAHSGRLIELTGCKGLRVGGAQVSTKHANFIVNIGKATCKDVKTLISLIQQRVYEKFGILLEPELVIL